MNVLLSGIVGSKAYGLAHEGSDTDRLGVFAEPTRNLLGLRQPRDSHVTSKPDVTFHEARKAARLMLSGNPTVMELLWLEEYETCTPLGKELLAIRTAFLSARPVRDAYLGYATSQFKRLQGSGDGSFASDSRRRSEKHARHLVRLLRQGLQLYTTGELTLRLVDPDEVRKLGETVAEDPDRAADLVSSAEQRFNAPGVLPEKADQAAVEAWLQKVREHYYTESKEG
jgi:uncharacterized protein